MILQAPWIQLSTRLISSAMARPGKHLFTSTTCTSCVPTNHKTFHESEMNLR